ncbi:MAG: DUF4292 domain-containing protein [Flammeovirgaceae bacterium]|nr:DUF4292 domain-containing protein [Flammeovirgaceae bacterium]MDW8287699.1 DUF4292 domain-containing protein [Flammeovirgaceae bacterium]
MPLLKRCLKLAVLLVLVASSCKKQLNIHNIPATSYEVDKLKYEYLQLKSKFNYQNGNDDIKALADIRVKKDSLIWFSIRHGTGIEGIRGVITKDSILIIDRIEKTYLAFDYPSLQQKLNFELSYDLLQSALIGEINLPEENTSKAIKEGGNFVVSASKEFLEMKFYVHTVYRKLSHVLIKDRRTQNMLEIDYAEFKEAQKDKIEEKTNQLFAHFIQAILDYKKEDKNQRIIVKLEHTKVEIMEKPIRFPFKMNDKFEKN